MKASAGSGKTWNLARKYITLLLKSTDRYAYRHILAVTFTNKATDEMKGRILKELHVLSVDPAASGYYSSFVPSMFPGAVDLQQKAESVLHDILHDYSAFAVSTIDRFFQQTLKAFSREIGQFASYQVELDKDSLVAESVDRMLDSLTEEDGNLLAWLTSNVVEQIEQGGRYSMDANLMEMAKRLKSPQRQEVLEKHKVKEDEVCSKEHLLEIRQRCREITDAFRKTVVMKAKEALTVLEDAGVKTEDSNRGFMNALYDYAELSQNDVVHSPSASFMSKAVSSEQWFSKAKAKTLLSRVYPQLEKPLNEFCALFGKEYAVYNTARLLDSQLYGLGVAGELDRTFRELMREKNVLCIDDSNTILRDIIDGSDAPFVYEKLGVRFEHFLLDEFQDTSKVQWQNFSPLLHNSDSQDGENLIVGDVKQSIYRWRGSDWKLLDRMIPAEFPDHIETVLDTNWRSLREIVQFNNGFFAAAAGIIDSMDGAGEEGPMSAIYQDVCQKTSGKSEEGGSVSLTFCPKNQELRKVLDSVMEVCQAGGRLSDVAVLVRSNAAGEAVAGYLIENGVSVITDDSLKVKNAITVRRLVSLMSYIDNPEDAVSGYLAESLDVHVPESPLSLADLAESLFRSLKQSDAEGIWKGEVLHVQSFMDCIQDYASVNGNGLRGFLKWWEEQNPSISSPSSGESVRIMTIHKSKGLDFPFVIIPFAENITLYKPGNSWCAPALEGSALEGVAEGVYDICLSSSAADTLFAGDYEDEVFLQHVDNMNTLYVAMTRAVNGMHIIASSPSSRLCKSLEAGDLTGFKDMSQILYWYVSSEVTCSNAVRSVSEDSERFDIGTMVDFSAGDVAEDAGVRDFAAADGDVYPSIPLNPSCGDESVDVRERGRLKFSADSVDFFAEDGESGISASNRIRGVVLHDILARVIVPSDLDMSVDEALISGEITLEEAAEIRGFLRSRIEEAGSYGWFSPDASSVLNEREIIDEDGCVCRPDRVVIRDGKVMVIDYKFGDHLVRYERQVRRYAALWQGMGYQEVRAYLWYVHTGEVREL